MKDNANKVVLAVVAIVAVATLALIVGSGSCSNAGGGGGNASTPNATSTSSTSSAASQSTIQQGNETGTGAQTEEGPMPVGANARSAATSASVSTSTAVCSEIETRGFLNTQVEVDFDINGNYLGMTPVDRSSSDKHPSYMFSYASTTGVTWFVYVNEGNYLAVPMAFGNSAPTKEIILTDSDVITQYDGTKNEYSDFSLDQISPAVGVEVAKIDAATLDSFTPDQLAKM